MTYWLFQKKVKDSVGVEICSDAQHLGQTAPRRSGACSQELWGFGLPSGSGRLPGVSGKLRPFLPEAWPRRWLSLLRPERRLCSVHTGKF